MKVPFVGKIQNGEVVKIECLDWTGGQIGNNDSADDVKNVGYVLKFMYPCDYLGLTLLT